MHGAATDYLGDGLLQLTHTALAGVVVDDSADDTVVELEVAFGEAMLLELTGDEMALGYLDFLFEYITAEVYHLKTVEECRLNGAEGVGSGDEEDVRKVVVQFEVVVVKSL